MLMMGTVLDSSMGRQVRKKEETRDYLHSVNRSKSVFSVCFRAYARGEGGKNGANVIQNVKTGSCR